MSEVETFYVFLSLSNPVIKSNFELRGKKIISAGFLNSLTDSNYREKYEKGELDYLPFIPNPNHSNTQPSSFQLKMTDAYAVEYNAEIARKNHFPTIPSRMSCIYAFKNLEDCKKVALRYGWNLGTVRKFYLEPHSLNRVHKVNMEVISLARGAGHLHCLDLSEQDRLWKHYWSGGGSCTIENQLIGTFSCGVIWEYLIEGVLILDE